MNNYSKNKIFYSLGNKNKSLMIQDNELWIGIGRIDNSYAFEKEVNSSSPVKKSKYIKFKSIEKYKIDNKLTIDYKTILGKKKKEDFAFDSGPEAQFVIDQLENKLNFAERVQKESIRTPLLQFGAPILLIIFIVLMLYLAGPLDDYEASGLRKSILKFIYNTIGIKGIAIIGVIASSVLGFYLKKRIQNPADEIIYEKP